MPPTEYQRLCPSQARVDRSAFELTQLDQGQLSVTVLHISHREFVANCLISRILPQFLKALGYEFVVSSMSMRKRTEQ